MLTFLREPLPLTPEKRIVLYQVLLFAVLSAGIILSGYLYYSSYEQDFQSGVEEQLTSVGDLKVNELVRWRNERIGDARVLYENPVFSSLVQELHDNPDNERIRNQVTIWLQNIQSNYHYNRVYLISPDGSATTMVPDPSYLLSSHILNHLPAVTVTRDIEFIDFYRDEHDGQIYLTILIPIMSGPDAELSGIVGLQISPDEFLYPYISQWPTKSESAETLLFRREGDTILYLNELRFRKDSALSYWLPINQTDLPEVKAALGEEGIVKGVDYRGVPVLANIRKIPDSPWFLVARIDTAEVLIPLQDRAHALILIVCSLLLGTGAILYFLRKRETERDFRTQLETKKALQESETLFRGLFDTMPSGAAIYSVKNDGSRGSDYIISDFNRASLRLEGKDKEEVVGKSLADLRPNIDEFGLIPIFQKVWETGETAFYPAKVYVDDVYANWYENYVFRLPTGQIVAIYNDVTETRRAEEALRQSEERLRLTLDATNDGIWDWNIPSGTAIFSPRWYSMLGYDPGEMPPCYDTWRSLLHPDDLVRTETAILDSIAKKEEGYTAEYRMRNHDGGYLWILSRGKIIERNAEGNPVRMVGTHTDISERKHAEEELERLIVDLEANNEELQAANEELTATEQVLRYQYETISSGEKALQQSEERLRLTLDATNDGVWDWNIKTGSIFLSPHYYLMLGYEPDGFPASHDTWKTMVHPDDLQKTEQNIFRYFQKPEGFYTAEFRMKHHDGEYLWILSRGKIIKRDAEGNPVRMVGTHTDISERKKMELSLRESEEKYREFFTTSRDGVFIISPDGSWIDYNHVTPVMFHYESPDELTQISLSHLFGSFGEWELFIGTVNADDGVSEYPAHLTRDDGTAFDASITAAPLKNPDGRVRGYIGTIRDVTERNQYEKDLILKDIFFNSSAVANIFFDMNGCATYVNAAFIRIWGAGTEDEVIGRAITDVIADPRQATAILEALNSKGVWSGDFLARRSDGSTFISRGDATSVRDQHGELLGYYSSNIDVSEKREYELRITREQERLFAVLENMPAFVYLQKSDYSIPFANHEFHELFGEIGGRPCYEVLMNRDHPCEQCPTLDVLATGTPAVWEWTNADGRTFMIYDTLFPSEEEDLVLEVGIEITKLKQAESCLKESEGRLLTLVHTIPDLVWLKDKEGVYLACNPVFERFIGIKESDLIGKTDYDLVEKELADSFREHDRRAIIAGRPSVNEEWVTFADDGHRSLLETIKTPMFDPDGTLIGVLGIGRDITERKLFEEQITIQNQRVELSQEIGKIGSWEFDLTTGKIWGSDEGFHIYGMIPPPDNDLPIDEIEACIPEHERVHQALIDLIEKNSPYNLEFSILPADGSPERVIISSAELIRDESGAPLKVVGVIQDITSRKKAETERNELIIKLSKNNEELNAAYEQLAGSEEELRFQYNALANAQERLREKTLFLDNLITSANVPIVVWDPAYVIIRINHAFENLVGRSDDQLIGQSVRILFPKDRADRSMRLIETTKAGVRWDILELPVMHADGTIKIVLWNSSTLYSQDGETVIATIAQGQDITHRKRLEKEHDLALNQIQKNLAQLSILNDQIRNPLMIILMASEMIDDEKSRMLIVDQINQIDTMVTHLDLRWAESEKVLSMIRKNYQIFVSPQIDQFGQVTEGQTRENDASGNADRVTDISPPFIAEIIQAELYTILDSIDSYIFVADLQTYELLYLNRLGRRLFGDIAGKTCFQIIQKDEGGPCSFCENHLLIDEFGPTGVRQREVKNTRNGRWYDCRDRVITWTDGRLVHLHIGTDISERKKIEDSLKENEYTFRKLYEESSDPILLMQDNRFIECNQAALDILGVALKDQFIGSTPMDISPEMQPDGRLSAIAAQEYIDRAHAEGRCRFDWMVQRYDGTPVLLEVSLFPIMFKGEEMLHITWRDVTERKKLEYSLRESEGHLRAILDSTPFPVALVDIQDNHIHYWSRSALTLFGHVAPTTAEWYEMAYPDPDYRQAVIDRWKPFLEIAKTTNLPVNTGEYRVSCRDGSVRICELYATFLPDTLIVTFNDVTERKENEDLLKKTNDELQSVTEELEVREEELAEKIQEISQAKQDWEQIFQSIGNPALILDINQRILNANSIILEKSGKTLDELKSLYCWELFHGTAATTPQDCCPFTKMIQSKKTESAEMEVEAFNGIYLVTCSPILDNDGSIDRVIHIAVDITGKKNAENALNEVNQKLRLLTGLTRHDIINQIHIIRSFCELAKESSDPDTIHSWVAKAGISAERIQSIIEFTREYEGFGMVSSDWQSVHQTIVNALSDITAGQVTLNIAVPPQLEVYADPLIRKVFGTLMENAIRHGGKISSITFSSQIHENQLTIICEDDGVGVPLEEKAFIFDQGYGKHTGVGLFIAREILSITGLSIRESGIPGKGARFEILVPEGRFRMTREN